MEVLWEMLAEGIEPNSITLNTIIHGLCQLGEIEQVKGDHGVTARLLN